MRGYHVATPNTEEGALVCSADRATAGRDDDGFGHESPCPARAHVVTQVRCSDEATNEQ